MKSDEDQSISEQTQRFSKEQRQRQHQPNTSYDQLSESDKEKQTGHKGEQLRYGGSGQEELQRFYNDKKQWADPKQEQDIYYSEEQQHRSSTKRKKKQQTKFKQLPAIKGRQLGRSYSADIQFQSSITAEDLYNGLPEDENKTKTHLQESRSGNRKEKSSTTHKLEQQTESHPIKTGRPIGRSLSDNPSNKPSTTVEDIHKSLNKEGEKLEPQKDGKDDKPKQPKEQVIDSRIPERVFKGFLLVFLFFIVVGCGLVGRVTLHILIWHLNPPTRNGSATINKLGGLYKYNCSYCSGENSTVCDSHSDSVIIDETWIWATFFVVTAPYFLIVLSTAFRICFKRNKNINCKVLLWVLLFETAHSVGLSFLWFIILPAFDPLSASVVYLSIGIVPSFLDIISKLIHIIANPKHHGTESQTRENDEIVKQCSDQSHEQDNKLKENLLNHKTTWYQKFCILLRRICDESSKKSMIYPVVGFLTQGFGIVAISLYINLPWRSSLYCMSVIFVSAKYWENYIPMGDERTGQTECSKKEEIDVKRDESKDKAESSKKAQTDFKDQITKSTQNNEKKGDQQKIFHCRTVKREFQTGRVKITFVVYFVKIIVTFVTMILIFVIRTTDSTPGFRALFDSGTSIINSVFGQQEIRDDKFCPARFPFLLALINIISDYLCYKASKAACVILCQRLGLSLPIVLLPFITTVILFFLMSDPTTMKFETCDLMFSKWCLTGISGITENCLLLVIAFPLLYISILIITRHVWQVDGYVQGETSRIFVSPFYCGVFLDLSLLLNRRRVDKEYDIVLEKDVAAAERHSTLKNEVTPKLYACATMWREKSSEMKQLLKSIFRLDLTQCGYRIAGRDRNSKFYENRFDFEAHIFFDDAFYEEDINEHVQTFFRVFEAAERKIYGTDLEELKFNERTYFETPYGGRFEWNLVGENKLVLHLKDKTKIRNKKRWSQVMYIKYILWMISSFYKNNNEIEEARKHSYILALDGDVTFKPEAVLSLMKRMKKIHYVGAACGRIHPIGTGPVVWYQKFEYAISHWLQKATEHVIGCVLCSPGCFSLFRVSALATVVDKYSKESTQPKHFVQFDQGEDRWLCTLLLKKRWKIEYCAESDAYTHAPEGFYEFYNQRRRWTPSTLANIIDVMFHWKEITRNENISALYIAYQMFLLVTSLLTPGAIFILIIGALIVGFNLSPWLALTLNIIPVGLFLLMCIFGPSHRQLQLAAILSHIYAIVMVIVAIGLIKEAAQDGFCSMPSIFLLFIICVFTIAAILHPKEILCLVPGLLYFIAVPSISMLMFFYAIANLHVISWGTREGPEKQTTETQNRQHFAKEDTNWPMRNLFRWRCSCCTSHVKDEHYEGNHKEISKPNRETNSVHSKPEKTKKTNSKGEQINLEMFLVRKEKQNVPDTEKQFWGKALSEGNPLGTVIQEERLTVKPAEMEENLLILRNKSVVFVFLLNIILVTIMYALTQVNSFKDALSITFSCGGGDVNIVPISVLFTVVFGVLLFLQFVCMIYHRFSTLLHILADTDITGGSIVDLQKTVDVLTSQKTTSMEPEDPMISDKTKPELDDLSLTQEKKMFGNIKERIEGNLIPKAMPQVDT